MAKLRTLSGFKAQYGDLTLVVVSEFDEWRVIVHAPGVILQGQRQYKELKAKEHALTMVQNYVTEIKGEAAQALPELAWVPTETHDWLVWST